MARDRRKVFFVGIGLAALGMAFVALYSVGAEWVTRYFPVAAGLALLASAAASRVPGLLLPGALFSGAGIGILLVLWLEPSFADSVGFVLLPIGALLSALPLASRVFGPRMVAWPVVSGAPLALVGLGMVVTADTSRLGGSLEALWPWAVAFSTLSVVAVFLRERRR